MRPSSNWSANTPYLRHSDALQQDSSFQLISICDALFAMSSPDAFLFRDLIEPHLPTLVAQMIEQTARVPKQCSYRHSNRARIALETCNGDLVPLRRPQPHRRVIDLSATRAPEWHRLYCRAGCEAVPLYKRNQVSTKKFRAADWVDRLALAICSLNEAQKPYLEQHLRQIARTHVANVWQDAGAVELSIERIASPLSQRVSRERLPPIRNTTRLCARRWTLRDTFCVLTRRLSGLSVH